MYEFFTMYLYDGFFSGEWVTFIYTLGETVAAYLVALAAALVVGIGVVGYIWPRCHSPPKQRVFEWVRSQRRYARL